MAAGQKDALQLVEYREEYDVIITWIIRHEQRLQELKDFKNQDYDELKDREAEIEVKD